MVKKAHLGQLVLLVRRVREVIKERQVIQVLREKKEALALLVFQVSRVCKGFEVAQGPRDHEGQEAVQAPKAQKESLAHLDSQAKMGIQGPLVLMGPQVFVDQLVL